MTCSGCSGAVTRVLEKAKEKGKARSNRHRFNNSFLSILAGDVSEFSVSLATQEVLVTGSLPYDEVYEKIKKTGKEVRCSFVCIETSFEFLVVIDKIRGDVDLKPRPVWIPAGLLR